jgi:hypothetical protein
VANSINPCNTVKFSHNLSPLLSFLFSISKVEISSNVCFIISIQNGKLKNIEGVIMRYQSETQAVNRRTVNAISKTLEISKRNVSIFRSHRWYLLITPLVSFDYPFGIFWLLLGIFWLPLWYHLITPLVSVIRRYQRCNQKIPKE